MKEMKSWPYAARLVLFLILNFGGLALGSFFTSEAVRGEWYQGLNKAPWTPPGWFFGFAWTSIMVCFSIWLASSVRSFDKKLLLWYVAAWMLNVAWNPLFFLLHQTSIALVVLLLLTTQIMLQAFASIKKKDRSGFLLGPYALWLLVASSLNVWVVGMN